MTAQMLILATMLAPAAFQAPTNPQPSSNIPDDRLAAVSAPAPITVEGCVATAREVNGRATNLAERVGLDDGFLLTSVRVVKGRIPGATTAAAAAPSMLAIAGLRDEQLKPHVGHRVRIEGSVVAAERPATGTAAPTGTLTVTTIRQLAGTCRVAPASEG